MSASTLRQRYPLFVELGLLVALALVIAAFAAPLDLADDVTVITTPREVVDVVEIPATEHRRELPPPPPPAPIEVPDTEVVVDVDIPAISNDPPVDPVAVLDLPAPPLGDVPEPEEEEIFVFVQEEPTLIGGIEGLQRRVVYPELARRAGIDGDVIVQFVVDKQGRVVEPVCLRTPGGGLCEAALDAVRASAFTPGKQRGKPVLVRFSLPVRFRLR